MQEATAKRKLRMPASHSVIWCFFLFLLVDGGSPLKLEPQAHQAGDLQTLVGQLGGSVRLPCLVLKRSYCGEPYFIAWYRLNGNRPSWTRIDYEEDQQAAGKLEDEDSSARQRFRYQRRLTSGCELSGGTRLDLGEVECSQLTISQLELADEGQYKCEITFSDAAEPEKCPSISTSRLTVIGL